jgi:hypothetical protein
METTNSLTYLGTAEDNMSSTDGFEAVEARASEQETLFVAAEGLTNTFVSIP